MLVYRYRTRNLPPGEVALAAGVAPGEAGMV